MDTLTIESLDEIRVVRLARPRRRNAINMQLLGELDTVLADIERDESIRALVITGDERAFCAGQDLKEAEPPEFVSTINAVFDRLEALPVPTVAAIDGWCLAGGLELALACDLRVCSERAQIGDRHVPIGSIGGAGATVRLTRLLGLARATELVFSAAVLEGEAARRLGLVAHVVADTELLERAVEHARGLCAGERATIAAAKKALRAAAELPFADAKAYALACQERLRAELEPDYGAGLTQRDPGSDD